MYDEHEDHGNVWAQRDLAAQMRRESQKMGHSCSERSKSAITNPIVLNKAHIAIDAGASQFESHEDVMAKLLGRVS